VILPRNIQYGSAASSELSELGKAGSNFTQPTAGCRFYAPIRKHRSPTGQHSNTGQTALSQSISKAHSPVLREGCCQHASFTSGAKCNLRDSLEFSAEVAGPCSDDLGPFWMLKQEATV
jgi:hypothetical protein